MYREGCEGSRERGRYSAAEITVRKVNLNKRGQSGGPERERWRQSPQMPAACKCPPKAEPRPEPTLRIYIPFSASHRYLSVLSLSRSQRVQSGAFCPARNVHQLFVRRGRVNRRESNDQARALRAARNGAAAALLFADSVRIVS